MNSKNIKTVCIYGLGYIGLPTLLAVSESNFKVVGIDKNKKVISNLEKGKVHFKEPKIDKLLKKVKKNKLISFSSSPKEGDIYLICVPTPLDSNKKNPAPDMKSVYETISSISNFLKKGDILILESTSPVGTIENICKFLKSKKVNTEELFIAYCPERVLPGNIFQELIHNDRIIGGLNSKSARKVSNFYKSFTKGSVYISDAKTAELCKLTENAFRDVNIAFANELSMISHNEGIDVLELIKLANKHPRVNILEPGCGVGGHCIPVDPWFIVNKDKENSKLIKTSRYVNDGKRDWIIKKIEKEAKKYHKKFNKKPKLAIFGISYKKDNDDIRESPSIYIAENLLKKGHNLCVVEPNLKSYKNYQFKSIGNSLKTDDIIIFLVRHKEFLGPKKFKKNQIILDFCNALN